MGCSLLFIYSFCNEQQYVYHPVSIVKRFILQLSTFPAVKTSIKELFYLGLVSFYLDFRSDAQQIKRTFNHVIELEKELSSIEQHKHFRRRSKHERE